MTRKSIGLAWLAGAMGAAMLCLGGAASAQDYGNGYATYYDDGYNMGETVIVHPEYGVIRHERVPGFGAGSLFNPEERVSLSEPVSFSDLNLNYGSDRAELRHRISDTAERICRRLAVTTPAGSVMETSQMDCVADATRSALHEVDYRY